MIRYHWLASAFDFAQSDATNTSQIQGQTLSITEANAVNIVEYIGPQDSPRRPGSWLEASFRTSQLNQHLDLVCLWSIIGSNDK